MTKQLPVSLLRYVQKINQTVNPGKKITSSATCQLDELARIILECLAHKARQAVTIGGGVILKQLSVGLTVITSFSDGLETELDKAGTEAVRRYVKAKETADAARRNNIETARIYGAEAAGTMVPPSRVYNFLKQSGKTSEYASVYLAGVISRILMDILTGAAGQADRKGSRAKKSKNHKITVGHLQRAINEDIAYSAFLDHAHIVLLDKTFRGRGPAARKKQGTRRAHPGTKAGRQVAKEQKSDKLSTTLGSFISAMKANGLLDVKNNGMRTTEDAKMTALQLAEKLTLNWCIAARKIIENGKTLTATVQSLEAASAVLKHGTMNLNVNTGKLMKAAGRILYRAGFKRMKPEAKEMVAKHLVAKGIAIFEQAKTAALLYKKKTISNVHIQLAALAAWGVHTTACNTKRKGVSKRAKITKGLVEAGAVGRSPITGRKGQVRPKKDSIKKGKIVRRNA